MPNRKAMVMSRIEKEQGCTLSSRAEIRTSGNNHAPLLLKSQIIEDVTELFLSITSATMTINSVARIMSIRFIPLWCYIRLNLNLCSFAIFLGEVNESVYYSNTRWPVSVRV